MERIVVATYVDGMVRVYAGIPQDGGMEQLGQFATARPIEPTALANLAVDLSAQFGWLEELAPVVVPVSPAKQVATPALPTAVAPVVALHKQDQQVACGTCRKQMRRDNLSRHLINVHGMAKERAYANARKRPAVGEVVASGTKTARKVSPNGSDLWKQRVACPVAGCGMTATRSNMARHLQSRKANHGYRHSEATELVRTLEGVAVHLPKPKAGKRIDGRINRQGRAGAAILETEVLPAVLAQAQREGTATSAEVAERYGITTGTALNWLRKLEAKGELVDVTQTDVVGAARTFAPRMATIPNGVTQTQLPTGPQALYDASSITETERV